MRKQITKIILIANLLLFTGVALCDSSNKQVSVKANIDEEIEMVYSTPTTSPKNKMFVTDKNLSFAVGSYDWHENDDWDWDTCASEYGFINKPNNDRTFYLMPAGGTYHPSFEFWVSSCPINNNSGFIIDVDFSDFLDSKDIKLSLEVRTSQFGFESLISNLTTNSPTIGASCYYYDYAQGLWIETIVDNEGYVALPDGYKGDVYIPINCYANISSNNVGIEDCYLQMYHLDFSISNNVESFSKAYFDEIRMVREDSVHEHNYKTIKTYFPTCSTIGLELEKCDCGQVKWNNFQNKKDHNVGVKYHCADNLTAALCNECKSLVYYNEKCNTVLADGVEITYEYMHDDVETQTRIYPKNYILRKEDIPYNHYISKGLDSWQLFRFTKDEVGLNGKNPLGYEVIDKTTFYGQYNFSSYDGEKYRAMCSDVSLNGGPYDETTFSNQVVFVGQSNVSLWHNLENWYANYGVPVRNNSIAGATSHNYLEFIEELVLMYKPQIVVVAVSSNDLAYHNMTDKELVGNMIEFYEIINANLPDVEIIFASGNPLPGRNEYFGAIKRVNKKIESFCETKSNAHYVEIYDITMEYVKIYPQYWDTWTHLEQSILAKLFGTEVYKVLNSIVEEKNITFK